MTNAFIDFCCGVLELGTVVLVISTLALWAALFAGAF